MVMSMASVQVEKQTAGESEVERLLSIIQKLPEPVGPTHPTNVQSSISLADNALSMQSILAILKGPRPPASDSKRAVYDQAVKLLGEGDTVEAIAYVQRAQMGIFSNIFKKMASGEDVGDRGPKLISLLQTVDLESGNYKRNTIEKLRGKLGGEELAPSPDETERRIGSEPIQTVEVPLFDLGAIHLLSKTADEVRVAFNATSSPELNNIFGNSSTNASQAINAIANGYATLINSPNDLSAQQAAAKSIFNSLSTIPKTKDMWNASLHPDFAKAMGYFQAGALKSGLDSLSQETSFSTLYDQLNNLYVVSINQRAIAVMRAGTTVRYNFDKNMEAFSDFMQGTREKIFEPRILYLGVGLYYEYLAMSGQLTQLTVTPGSTTPIGKGKTTPLTGTGNVFTVNPQIGIGTSAWGNPIEIVLHASTGYEKYALGTNIQMNDGTMQKVNIEGNGAYIGLWGVEMRTPGKEGKRRTIRMERFGAGAVGTPSNPLAYVTFSGNWRETSRMRIQSFMTPQYSYFLSQHRAGGDMRPMDMTLQLNPKWSLNVGPGIRYDYNFGNENHTMEFYGTAGFRFSRGLELDLKAGYMMEKGGAKGAGERLPSTPFGSVNLTLTPKDWFKTSSNRKIIQDTIPTKKTVEKTTEEEE